VTGLAAAVAVLLAVCCFANEAAAHAALIQVEPRDGSVLADPPKRVELRFSETVTPGAINLIDANGRLRDDATVDAKGDSIIIRLPPDLPRGTDIVSYRIISQDGHPVAGSVTFSIGETSETKPHELSRGPLDVMIWLSRIGVYLGLFGGIGGAFFLSWIARARLAVRPIIALLGVGAVSATASLGIQGLDVLGLSLTGLARLSPWKIAFGTSLGPSLLIAIAAMVTALLSLLSKSEWMLRALAAIAFASVGLSLAASGHAATASPQLLTRPVMFLHGLGAAFWLGALLPLAVIVWQQKREALPVVRRFSVVAVFVVGLLVLTGIPLAVIQVETFSALVETRYGMILLIKLALVVLLLLLAARHRFRLTPALAVDPGASRPLARSIAVECIIAAILLCDIAGWRFTPPPRSIVAEAPLAVHIHTDKAMFQVLVSPARVGANNFVLQLMTEDGSSLVTKEARLTLSMPSRSIEGLERMGTLGSDGYWYVTGVLLSVPGRWHMRIDALVSDFQEISLEDDFDVSARAAGR